MSLQTVAPPAYLSVPPRVGSAGQEATDLAASAGLFLDPWQAHALDVALGERADGKWAAFEVALVVPRQNGKGSILEALVLACLILFGDRLILHSAHEFKTAQEAFLRILALVENCDDLRKRFKKPRTSHGEEGLELLNGNRLRFVARSTGSGRGFSGDKVILDEAFNLSDKHLSALLPTMSARPNPQLWYTSSAPLEGPESGVLRRLCKRGRTGSERLAYIEYCADKDADHHDRQAWVEANPGMGIRIPEEFIESEQLTLEPVDFARERLGIWPEDADLAQRVIPAESWEGCRGDSSPAREDFSFALDVAPDRSSAHFAVASESRLGGVHLEVVVDDQTIPGTGWVVKRAKELQDEWGGVLAIAQNSPAWSLQPELEVEGVVLLPVSTTEHAQACGKLFDAIIDGQVHHVGQPVLNRAVAGAAKKFYGDAWLWSRKTSAVDIAPLVAVTLAHWAHWARSHPIEAAAEPFMVVT